MKERKIIASRFIEENYPKKLILEVVGIPRSTYYYTPKQSGKTRGVQKSKVTLTTDGEVVSNTEVIEDIKKILGKEFVDYGYLKVTHWLRQNKNYIINPKKTYRLMTEEALLNKVIRRKKGKRNWVKELLPPAKDAFDYLEFDIKYFYVAGKNRNALLLSIIDVKTRWVLGQVMFWEIKQADVTNVFNQIFEVYPLPKHFYVRNDNGSQFIAKSVQEYFEAKGVTQEFCKPATPEQNAHISPYHFLLENMDIDMKNYDLTRVLDCSSLEVFSFN